MIKLSIPGMVSMLVMTLYNIVDTFWVSGLPNGTEAIAALTILFPLQMIAGAVGLGTGAGVMSLVSRRYGQRRVDEVNLAAGHAISLPMMLGLTFTLAGVVFADPLVRSFGATPELVGPSIAYLTTVSFGFPFQMMGMSLNGLYRGSGNAVTPMLIMLVAAVTNAGLDPLFIYGWAGFPRLGIQGAAVATVIAQVAACLVSFAYLRNQRSGFQVRWRNLIPRWRIIIDIAQVGAPAAVMNCIRSLVAVVYNWVLAGFGSAAIAAHGLGHRVLMLVVSCLGGGVHQALMPIVGYTFGARNYRRMWRAYGVAAVWTSSGGLLLGGLVIAFAPQILAPFAHEPELLHLGVISLRLKMCTFFLIEPQMMAIFSLQGMGMGGRAMVLTLSRNAIFVVPALFLLSARFGVTGAFAAQPVSDVLALFVAAGIMSAVYRRFPPAASVPQDESVASGR